MARPDDLGGRLPPLAQGALSAAQKQLYQRMLTHQIPWSDRHNIKGTTSDGRLIGPYNPLLYSPGVGAGFLDFEAAEDQSTSLDERTRQVVILSAGSVWQPDYEIYAHTALAEQTGLSEEAIQAIPNGQPADELTGDEKLAQAYALQLTSEHSVDATLYEKTESAFGRQGLVDITLLVGRYLIISALLNGFDTPRPCPPSSPSDQTDAQASPAPEIHHRIHTSENPHVLRSSPRCHRTHL